VKVGFTVPTGKPGSLNVIRPEPAVKAPEVISTRLGSACAGTATIWVAAANAITAVVDINVRRTPIWFLSLNGTLTK
jgi:hypothetical protein